MKNFALTPLDAWFFRDGRPYEEKEANQADVVSSGSAYRFQHSLKRLHHLLHLSSLILHLQDWLRSR